MAIEYDPDKNAIHIHKHGLSFTNTTAAFNDPNALITYDEIHSDSEDRFNLLGSIGTHILFIVYTMRGEVNARPAAIKRYNENKNEGTTPPAKQHTLKTGEAGPPPTTIREKHTTTSTTTREK